MMSDSGSRWWVEKRLGLIPHSRLKRRTRPHGFALEWSGQSSYEGRNRTVNSNKEVTPIGLLRNSVRCGYPGEIVVQERVGMER